MLTLLRDLRRLRRTLDVARPARPSSLALRHVDAGSCNGCEHELTLLSSPYYDLERFGIGVVASPRHADVLLVTGVVTTRMPSASCPISQVIAMLGRSICGQRAGVTARARRRTIAATRSCLRRLVTP